MRYTAWGLYPVVEARNIQLRNIREVADFIDKHTDIIPYGNGRSYGDSALSRNIVDTRSYDHFLSFDEQTGTLHVQAGATLEEIISVFAPRGWFPKITPGTKFITVGGAIAADVHGKNHHVAGCFSECVEEFRLLLPDGTVQTCTRDKTPELFRATCGGNGLTGVILDAKIRLQKIDSVFLDQTTIKTGSLEETFEAFENSKDVPYSVAWIDCLASGRQQGRSVLMLGKFRSDGNLNYKPKRGPSVPFHFPSFALNTYSVRAFNHMYYKKAPNGVTKSVVSIDQFFYPLDAIHHWNRIYGKRGFTQYQFILPKDSSLQGLKEILDAISQSGQGSFLAVLKLYGPSNDNYLSFPMEGYSLALDFKISRKTFKLLDKLDRIVLRHGGRLYLTKDVRVRKEVFEKGYPRVDDFRTLRKDLGMHPKFNSLQSKRVEI